MAEIRYLCITQKERNMDIKQLYQLYRQHPQITTDSRNCPKDSIFVALKGESFDGNKFAASALEKGCSFAIIDEEEYHDPNDKRLILVNDCLVTFKELAREHRRQFNIPVIGITGTNGKTTTKELVSAVLAEKYNVMHTEGNFNNDVGVPKTLLRLSPENEIAVVEMGASHPGDIKKLVEYAEPTCALVTNVGRAHLQGFGSFEGVMKTKGELYDFMQAHGGIVFLNNSNEHLVEMAQERKLEHIISYGENKQACVQGTVTKANPCIEIEWWTGNEATKSTENELLGCHGDNNNSQAQRFKIKSNLIGSYNLDNLLAAISVGLHFGVSPRQICHALENYTPTNNRSELIKTNDNVLVVDAYNANPTSMAAALDSFESLDMPQPKMAILGDMRELGTASEEEHQKVADSLNGKNFSDVWLVGEEFMKTHCEFRKFKDVSEVKAAIANEKPHGKCILVKGSNGIRLFELPEVL